MSSSKLHDTLFYPKQKRNIIDDLDEGVFADYFDFSLDPDLDPRYYDLEDVYARDTAVAEAPPTYTLKVGSHSMQTKSEYKLPKRDKEDNVAIAEEGDIRYIDEYWRLDPRIKKLQAQIIPPTPVNLEWAFWHEPTCRAMATSIFATIVGDGPQIVTRNEKIKKILDDYNKFAMIVDIIRDLVFDNIIHGDALFLKRIVKIGDVEKLKLFRIDMRTVRRLQHDFEGWLKWKQYAFVRAQLPKKKKDFENKAFDPMPMIDPNFEVIRGEKGMIHTTQMVEDEVLYFNLFRESPMMGVLDIAIHKKWIIIFMRKSAYRFSTPVPIITVGTELHHPTSVDNYKKILANASKRASMWRNFDAWAVPFNWRMQMEQPRDAGTAMVSMLEFLNKEIMLGLSGSISLFQNVGSAALSTGTRSITENFLRIVRGMRTKIAYVLEKLYREVLILEGFSEDELDKEKNMFEIDWTELTDESTKDYVDNVLKVAQAGLLKDKVEARNLLRKQMTGLEEIEDEAELNGDNKEEVMDLSPQEIIPDDDMIADIVSGMQKGAKVPKQPVQPKTK